jgi:CD36 family
MMNAAFAENNDTFFMKARIGNITFDGIDSPLLHMGEDTMLGGAINIPFDRFGWFYGVRYF